MVCTLNDSFSPLIQRDSQVAEIGFQTGGTAFCFNGRKRFRKFAQRGDFGLRVVGRDFHCAGTHGNLLFRVRSGRADVCSDLVARAVNG